MDPHLAVDFGHLDLHSLTDAVVDLLSTPICHCMSTLTQTLMTHGSSK